MVFVAQAVLQSQENSAAHTRLRLRPVGAKRMLSDKALEVWRAKIAELIRFQKLLALGRREPLGSCVGSTLLAGHQFATTERGPVFEPYRSAVPMGFGTVDPRAHQRPFGGAGSR